MEINLAKLCEMHPRLPEEIAILLTVRAGLGLQRNGHEAPAYTRLEIERIVSQVLLAWPGSSLVSLGLHDSNQVTEDGAEAVALALAGQVYGWKVVRRMQREEHADWLLEDFCDGVRRMVALEVSGVDRGSIARRLASKLAQVALTEDVDQRWAGVVGFEGPAAALCSTNAARE